MRSFRRLNWRYAIGELLIVFVGIMSAVQVDRWNTGRLDRAASDAYLDRIAVDLEADLAFLGEIGEASRAQSESVDRFLLFLGGEGGVPSDSAIATQVVEVLTSGGARIAFGLRTGTFRDMLSTGSLALVEDPELRDSLISYYEDATVPLADRATEFHASEVYNPLQELFARHVDYRVLYGSLKDLPGSRLLVTNWGTLANDADLRTQLQRLSAGAFDLAKLYSRLAETTRSLREQVVAAR